MKKTQLIMLWFLPLILIGGLFYPELGYLALLMMAALVILSFFAGRYWCWNLCPRGAFLDIAVSKVSPNRPAPALFAKGWFRWSVFFLLVFFVGLRVIHSGWNLLIIGAIFVSSCLLTTVISVILGIFIRHRAWCMICPMGLLQEKIGKIRK